jgi:D-xylose transport system permease protein
VSTSSPSASPAEAAKTSRRDWRSLLASTEIDTRFAGMVAALAVIWLGFHFLSDGAFLTSRNLWNL